MAVTYNATSVTFKYFCCPAVLPEILISRSLMNLVDADPCEEGEGYEPG